MKKITITSFYCLIFGFIFFLFDLFSKYFVSQNIPLIGSTSQTYPYGGIGVFKNFFGIEFSIVHATNTGAAWGILGDYQIPLLIFRILLLLTVFIFLLFYNKNKSIELPLAIIIAGATANILDYFIYGHVVDMFHFVFWGYDYPIFNIADSGICISVLWLMFLSSPLKKDVRSDP